MNISRHDHGHAWNLALIQPNIQISDGQSAPQAHVSLPSSTHFPASGHVTHPSSRPASKNCVPSTRVTQMQLHFRSSNGPLFPNRSHKVTYLLKPHMAGSSLPLQPATSLILVLFLQHQLNPMSFLVSLRVHWQVPPSTWLCSQSQSVYKYCALELW